MEVFPIEQIIEPGFSNPTLDSSADMQCYQRHWCLNAYVHDLAVSGLILGLRPANGRRRYFVTTFIIGWAQA